MYKFAMKLGAPFLPSTRSLDWMRERFWHVHYSLNIVKYYVFDNIFLYIYKPMGSFNAPPAKAPVGK